MALHHPRERVAAATALLDRGWGKPKQTIETTSDSTVLHLIAAQLVSTELVPQQAPTIEHAPGVDAGETPKE